MFCFFRKSNIILVKAIIPRKIIGAIERAKKKIRINISVINALFICIEKTNENT
jgi:hypothetical protein